MNPKRLAIRLEGTLCPTCDPGIGDVGPPDPKAVDLLTQYEKKGWEIIVYTALANYDRWVKIAQMWLIEHGVPFHELWGSPGFPIVDKVIDFQAETK